MTVVQHSGAVVLGATMVKADCPVGTVRTGGGALLDAVAWDSGVRLQGSYPATDGPQRWWGIADSDAVVAGTLVVYVLCAG